MPVPPGIDLLLARGLFESLAVEEDLGMGTIKNDARSQSKKKKIPGKFVISSLLAK